MKDLSRVKTAFVDFDDTCIKTNHLYVTAREKAFRLIARWTGADREKVALFFQTIDAGKVRAAGHTKDRFAESMIDTLDTFATHAGYTPTQREYDHLRHLGQSIFDLRGDNLDGVEELLAALTQDGCRLVLYSAGIPEVQQQRLAWSGLEGYFSYVQIIAKKTPDALAVTLGRLGLLPFEVVMIGNSPAQDIAPAVAEGCAAIWLDGARWEADQAPVDLDQCYHVTNLDEARTLIIENGAYSRRFSVLR